MRVLILNTDYARFLDGMYRAHPGLERKSYEEQRRVRNDTLFGFADFYTRGFEAQGHTAAEIHVDNPWTQAAWAREHGMTMDVPPPGAAAKGDGAFKAWLKYRLAPYREALRPVAAKLGLLSQLNADLVRVLLAQIEDFRPDVILNQNLRILTSDILRRVKTPSRVLITQIGVDPPRDADLGIYDLGISLIPWVVEYFRSQGLRAERCDLGFEPTILDRLGPQPEQDIPLSFVGSLSASHTDRIEFLEQIARKHPLALWVPSLEGLPASSPLHACRRGEVYGREMYDILRRSKITLNSHVNVTRGLAGNMRLYEATGAGTLLLTDDLADLPRLFEPGREVATYRDTVDCIEKIGRFLNAEDERTAIAAAGQARTLREHTYRRRTERIAQLAGMA